MKRICLPVCAVILSAAFLAGCGNPIKRDPANVFPGSPAYQKRVSGLKISPREAYSIAHKAAEKEGKLQFLSRTPTVVVRKTYVFSMPQPSGASLNGYHVDGNRGTVRFVTDKTIVTPR